MSTIRYIEIEIEKERAAQDRQWGGAVHDDKHGPWDWIAILCRHLGLAVGDGGGVDRGRYRRQLVRVAAIAIAAIESHDRKYPKQKPAGEFQQGSGF